MSKKTNLLAGVMAALLLLGSCNSGKGSQDSSDTSDTDTLISKGDETMDTEPILIDPMADKDKETLSDGENGSFYDSFTTDTSKWKVNDSLTTVSAEDGAMKFVTTNNNPDGTISRINTSAATLDRFIVEFRLRIEEGHAGRRIGFRFDMGDSRIMMLIYPDAVLFYGAKTNYDDIDLEIGYDWHTYRLIREGNNVHLYFDDSYVTTIHPQTGSYVSGMMFIASAATAYSANFYLDYITYQPLQNEIELLDLEDGVEYSNSTRLTLTASIDSSLYQDGEDLVYYANGIRIGSSDKKNIGYSVDWENIEPGVYYVSAKYGDTESYPYKLIFSGSTSSDKIPEKAEGKVSDDSTLLASYDLVYEITDTAEATVSAKNGTFALKLTHSDGKATILTADGEAKIDCGIGFIRAAVDGGVCNLYRNDRILASFRMPTDFTVQNAVVSGNSASITGLNVEAGNETWYSVKVNGAYERELEDFGVSYAVEFVYDPVKDAELALYDGLYKLKLTAKDGELFVLEAPRGIDQTTSAGQLPEGKKVYRITVGGGIALLYADNKWITSFRLPASNATPYFFATGEMQVEIRNNEETYYEDIDFTDTRYLDYVHFERDGSGSTENGMLTLDQKDSTYAVVTENFSHNAVYEVTADLNGKTTGGFYLLARYTNEYSGLYAGYNFDKGQYEIVAMTTSGTKVLGSLSAAAPEGKTVFSLTTKDNIINLTVNGTLVLSLIQTTINGYANNGIQTDGGVKLENISYVGDGYIQRSAYAAIRAANYPDITELPDGTLLMADNGAAYTSEDGGITWTQNASFNADAMSRNVITLSNGKLLTIRAKSTNKATLDYAYISEDGGKTFKGPFQIQGKASDRICMNCKVIEATSGRIFYSTNETGHAVEHGASIGIYYSDNGIIWKEPKTTLDYQTTGLNLQEPVITDLGDGTLRLFVRNGNGFLYYSDSFDNGETWETEFHPTIFPAVCSAFNIERDRETGYLWASWEYNCTNDHGTIQYPRTRIGLAVSFDGGKNWSYVADVDDYSERLNSANHYNIGINVTSDYIFVTAIKVLTKSGGTENKNLVVRYEKDKLISLARFSRLHILADHSAFRGEYTDTVLENSIVASENTLFVGGSYTDPVEYAGSDTYITLNQLAGFIGGEYAGGKITFGKTVWAFTDGSSACEAYESLTMKNPAQKVSGQLAISLADAAALFELTLYEGNGYTAVYYAPYRIDFDYFDMHIRSE